MTIDFYYHPDSAPCRSIQMTANAIGVELNLKSINLRTGENLTPEFMKINPLHSIPVLVDNGYTMTESRAIMVYLVEKYGKLDDTLYPQDVKQRAVINQRFFFDMSLYSAFAKYYYPALFHGATELSADDYAHIEKKLGFLNTFLEAHTYAVGDTFTLADIALVATISSFVHEDGFQLGMSYPNVTRWFNKCKSVIPRYDINVTGVQIFKKLFRGVNQIKVI